MFLIDHRRPSYASILFLFRLREGRHTHRRRLSIPGVSNDTNLSEATKSQCPLRPGLGWVSSPRPRPHRSRDGPAVSYYDRLKTLFWISVSNFVFPVVLDLALLVLAFREGSFLDGAYVLLVSNYVDIVGVLLATIWTTSTKYPPGVGGIGGGGGPSGAAIRSRMSPRFAVVTVDGEGESEEPLEGLGFGFGREQDGDGDSIPMTVFTRSPSVSGNIHV